LEYTSYSVNGRYAEECEDNNKRTLWKLIYNMATSRSLCMMLGTGLAQFFN